MNKTLLAELFGQMADLMEILGEDRFRVISYRTASRVVAESTADLEALAKAGQLQTLPGIGKSTEAKILEYIQTGQIARHQELLAKVPPGLAGLLRLQHLGPKTALKLWKELDIRSLDDLREVLANHPERIEDLPGMGAKKVALLKESAEFTTSASGRHRIDEALEIAAMLESAVKACKGVDELALAGSARRWRETVGDIDILVSAGQKSAARIMEAFRSCQAVTKVLAGGQTKCSVIVNGKVQADLRVVGKESFGAALQYFTGSKDHNVALRGIAIKHGWKLNEYGLFEEKEGKQGRRIAGADEEGIYRKLGLAWVPPELRENRGEIEAAAAGKLPRLLEEADIQGDLHMHTTATDGAGSITDMIESCRAMGYKYLAITDHSRSQPQTGGLSPKALLEHAAAVRAAAKDYPDMLVLAGTECDILKDGTLDYPDDVLAKLDFVLAAPHAALNAKGPAATERLLRAIANPHVHAIAHPTGRLINERAGMEVDIQRICQAAAEGGVALEVNAHPLRLDLRDVHVQAAVKAGAKLVICTDAHTPGPAGDLALMRYGVATARRGWATPDDVINAWPAGKLRAFLQQRRPR
jgi:DNA polymerase (family 10)